MKQQWLVWSSKFNELSPRERILITLALFVVIGMLLFMPLESLWKQQQSVQNQLKGLEQENSISLQQVALYEERLQLDPNQDYQQRLQLITEQMQLIDADLSNQIMSFASIAPKALLQVGDGSKVNLYSHGIKLTLQGDYFSILAFIKAVESMPDKLYWKRLDYRVESHPDALVELELYTLSVNKDFISVAKQD